MALYACLPTPNNASSPFHYTTPSAILPNPSFSVHQPCPLLSSSLLALFNLSPLLLAIFSTGSSELPSLTSATSPASSSEYMAVLSLSPASPSAASASRLLSLRLSLRMPSRICARPFFLEEVVAGGEGGDQRAAGGEWSPQS